MKFSTENLSQTAQIPTQRKECRYQNEDTERIEGRRYRPGGEASRGRRGQTPYHGHGIDKGRGCADPQGGAFGRSD